MSYKIKDLKFYTGANPESFTYYFKGADNFVGSKFGISYSLPSIAEGLSLSVTNLVNSDKIYVRPTTNNTEVVWMAANYTFPGDGEIDITTNLVETDDSGNFDFNSGKDSIILIISAKSFCRLLPRRCSSEQAQTLPVTISSNDATLI